MQDLVPFFSPSFFLLIEKEKPGGKLRQHPSSLPPLQDEVERLRADNRTLKLEQAHHALAERHHGFQVPRQERGPG